MNVAIEQTKIGPGQLSSRGLLSSLKRLDTLLQHAVERADQAYGSRAGDNFRGLYVSHADVEDLLAREPAVPRLNNSQVAQLLPTDETNSEIRRLQQLFSLSDFELDVVCMALAPELDLKYERLYAYLQDDVTRRHPTIDLALNVLCTSAEDRIDKRVHFAPDGPLLRHGIIRVFPDPHHSQPSLLSHYFRLDPQIVQMLLSQLRLDNRLRP